MATPEPTPEERRTKALEDISRKMGDITNHMTGLMFMFAKCNEMYHALAEDEAKHADS